MITDKSNPYDRYKRNDIETASPEKLLLMLYEALLKHVRLAKIGIDEKDYYRVNEYLSKCNDIIGELRVSLDYEQGGEVAINLDRLYDYVHTRITEANIKKDKSILEEVTGIISELKEAWDEVYKNRFKIGIQRR